MDTLNDPVTPHIRQSLLIPGLKWLIIAIIHLVITMFGLVEFSFTLTPILLVMCSWLICNLLVLIAWYNRYFQIFQGVIMVREGIFWLKKRIYSLENLQKVINRRPLLGRIFHYGTIRIEIEPFSTQPIHVGIPYIHDSQSYVEILRNQMFEYMATSHQSRVTKASNS